MIVSTKAIVLNALKFQDSSLIVKCYTHHGIRSYLLKGILKAKRSNIKPAYFQLFTLLDIVANHNDKGNLNYIREVSVYEPLHSIYTNIHKNTIVVFLAEILTHVLKEEEVNLPLYTYIEKALMWLDKHDEVSNFHLLFLLNLTKYLGFYPKTNFKDALFFNLTDGVFTQNKPKVNFITNKELELLKSLIGINFDAISSIKIDSELRQSFLTFLINYFALHLPEFKQPRSIKVLHTILR